MDPAAVINRLQPGDHVCWAFDDDASGLETLVGYVRGGLDSGQKTVIFTHTLRPDAMKAGLAGLGVPSTALTAGQVEVRPAAEAYLPDGVFQPARMLEALNGLVSTAHGEGWAGLRLAGDMGWATGTVPGVEHLPWYEAQVNRLYANGYAMGLCLYDRRLFTSDEVELAGSAHLGTTGAGFDGRRFPLLRMQRTTKPVGLRLSGEADLSNRHALTAVLTDLVDDLDGAGEPGTIDVSELAFADGATGALFIRASQAAPTGLRFVGCSTPLIRVLELVAEGKLPDSIIVERRP